MKRKLLVILFAILLFRPGRGLSQTINWRNLGANQNHLLYANAGLEYGVVYGVGYGYHLPSKIPVVLSTGISFPSGKYLFDDFKIKSGGQAVIFRKSNLWVSGNFNGIFRRYGSDFVRLLNFGTDLSLTTGYYKTRWFVAGEFGFDKAIVTNFKHSDSYKKIFPLVQDGWYEAATGGNFYYNLQTGFSFERTEITLKVGKLIEQDFKTSPLIPVCIQFGINYKI